MKTKTSWMDNDVADAVGDLAFKKARVKASPFRMSLQDGEPGVIVMAQARCPTQQTIVRMPKTTLRRLRELTRGGHTVAISALVEHALDELERQGKQLVVEQA